MNRLSTQQQDNEAQATQRWDDNSRLVTFDEGSPDGKATYGYNADGALTSMVEPGGTCAGYSLDQLPPASAHCILFDVDRDGQRLRTIFPGDVGEQIQTFDQDGRPSRIAATGQTSAGAGTTFYDYTYDYKKTGHLMARRDSTGEQARGIRVRRQRAPHGRPDVQRRDRWHADVRNQLLLHERGDRQPHGHHPMGTSCSAQTAATYDGANQRYDATGHYAFDLDGDETKAATSVPAANTTRTSTWSDTQQLTGVSINGVAALQNTYIDGGNGNLIASDTSATETDVWTTRRSASRGRGTSGTVRPPSTRGSSEIRPARLLALRTPTSRYFVQTDNLGSVLRVLDAAGVTMDAYSYDSFGGRTASTDNLRQPFGYLGGYTNPGTGLVHFGARWYDPSSGRFTQLDT